MLIDSSMLVNIIRHVVKTHYSGDETMSDGTIHDALNCLANEIESYSERYEAELDILNDEHNKSWDTIQP